MERLPPRLRAPVRASHGRLPGFRTPSGGGCVDVGVDNWYYAPVRWADIKRQLETLPVVQQEEYEGDDD